MKRRFFAVLLAAALAAGMAGCGQKEGEPGEKGAASGHGAETSDPEAEAAGQEAQASASDQGTQYHTGTKVSRAYVDPSQTASFQEERKAGGFEYDREALTWELVWADEFDYEGDPDPEKWSYDVGGGGWGNNELQYYTRGDNAAVTDGCLVIQARKETVGGRDYTSARLVTREKGDWLYGRIEIRAKLPSGLGTWPAAWMLPTDYKYGSWPASGEIDIMEHVGYDQDVIVQSVHNQKFHGGQSRSGSYPIAGVSEDFHVYTVEWLPDMLIFGVDGEELFTYDPESYSQYPTYELWPFDKRMHILLNLAFGGDWGGARGTEDSYFPVEYYVDYVRVYQSPEIMELTGQEMELSNE